MGNIQQTILEKRLEFEFEQLLQQVLDYCCNDLSEGFDAVIKSKNDLNSELLKVRYNLENFFRGSLSKSTKKIDKCDPKEDSFYIHVFKSGLHIVEIRISGHGIEHLGKEVYKINKHSYNVLYIDYSKYVSEPYFKSVADYVRNRVSTQIDYLALQHNSKTSLNLVVNAIMNIIFVYLLNNKLAQATKDKLQITWSV